MKSEAEQVHLPHIGIGMATCLGSGVEGQPGQRLLACVHASSKGRHGGAARRCRVQLWLRACAGEGCRGGVTISYRRLLGSSSRRSPSCVAAGVSMEGGGGRKEK